MTNRMIRGNDNEKNELMSKTSTGNVSCRPKMCIIPWKPCKDVGGRHSGQIINFYHFRDPGWPCCVCVYLYITKKKFYRINNGMQIVICSSFFFSQFCSNTIIVNLEV